MNKAQEETIVIRLLCSIQDELSAINVRLDAMEAKSEAPEPNDLLTIKDTAKVLKTGFNRAKELITRDDNPIPSIKVGKRVKVSRTILNKWIEDNSESIDIKAIADTYCAMNPR